MGIDAEMFLIVPYEPEQAQLLRWSWEICKSIGADNFLLAPERKPPRGVFETVPIWEQDGPDIIPEPGQTFIKVHVWTRYYGEGYERGNLIILCAIAEWCEQNIQGCEVWYGGDSSGVCAEPWPEEIRKQYRRHLYSSGGRDYYDGFGGVSLPHEAAVRPDLSKCGLCIPGKSITRYGWGGNYAAYNCHGCGRNFITKDNGLTWTNKDTH